jgi:DNA repair exonuclease SbcCD ATPase subunit
VNRCDTRQSNNDTFIVELFGELADFSLTNLLNKESSLDLLSMTAADQVKTLKTLFKMDIYDTYRDLNKKRLVELESSLTKLRVKVQSFQTLIDPNVTEDAVQSLKNTVALKSGEEEEERETLEQAQLEYQELNSQLRLLESRSNFNLNLSLNFEELQAELDELGPVPDPGPDAPGSEVLTVKLDSTQAKIKRLQQELNEVDFVKLQSPEELESLLVELTTELRAFELATSLLPPATVNKKLGVIQAKLEELEKIPETREIKDITAEINELKVNLTVNLPEVLYSKKQLGLRTEPTNGETLETLTDKLIPGVPTEFTAVHSQQLSSKISELEECSTLLEEFQSIVITDTKNVIEQLCDCPLMDEDGSKTYGLNGEYRLVEDPLMERLIVHFENEQEHQKVIPMMTKHDSLTQQVEHLRTMKSNNVIQRQINWLKYEELTAKQKELEHLATLEEELQHAEARAAIQDLKQQYEELESMITYYEITEDIKIVKENLEFHRLKDELYGLLNEQEELKQQLHNQEAWERFNYLSKAIESYVTIKELETLRSVVLRHQRQIPMMKGNLQATQRSLKLLEEQMSRMELKLEQQVKYREELETVQSELIKLEQELKPLTDYGILMGSRGIASRMLFNKISSIQGYINDILNSFTRYTISIIFDDKKQTMSIIAVDKDSGKALSTTRFSGYEKLMLQIALKRALNKYSYNSKSSLIIIDEALDCIDSMNFDTKLPDIMCLITQDYSTCLAISQRDISHVSDVNMSILRDGGASRLE